MKSNGIAVLSWQNICNKIMFLEAKTKNVETSMYIQHEINKPNKMFVCSHASGKLFKNVIFICNWLKPIWRG